MNKEHEGWSLMHAEDAARDHRYVTVERMEVPGGWLYRTTELQDSKPLFVNMCFVPEPDPET